MAETDNRRIAVGVIRKAHGVRGEASVEPWTSSAARFSELRHVTLVSPDEKRLRPAEIESARTHGERALVKFTGIDSPEAVRALRDWTVEIAESEARPLEAGEVYLHDLPGLRLVDRSGADRGTVRDVIETAAGVLLIVETATGATYDVPFAAEICLAIDLGERTILVELPAGLDDLANVED